MCHMVLGKFLHLIDQHLITFFYYDLNIIALNPEIHLKKFKMLYPRALKYQRIIIIYI